MVEKKFSPEVVEHQQMCLEEERSRKVKELKRYKLVLEFDGSRYSGWQKQDDAATIQGTLIATATEQFVTPVDVQGCGRTDAGVHGLHFVAHLEMVSELSPREVLRKLNASLPRDIVVRECKRAGERFHARHNCIARSYLYRIALQPSAFDRNLAWLVEGLDLERMQAAAAVFVGMHDFTSFTDRQVVKKKSPLVLVHQCLITATPRMIELRIVGSHFLWKMVRRMTGVLVAVGKGELSEVDVRHFLADPVLLKQYTAPARGLFLEQAFYHQEELDTFLAISGKEREVLSTLLQS